MVVIFWTNRIKHVVEDPNILRTEGEDVTDKNATISVATAKESHHPNGLVIGRLIRG